MCFHSQQTIEAKTLEHRFKAQFKSKQEYTPGIYNGFTHPYTPIIKNTNPEIIDLYSWGLIPSWSNDLSFRKNTINARVETIKEKPSFRNHVSQRCLILLSGFYEWQWLDEKGKQKQKYLLSMGESGFAVAGLWNEWIDKITGEIIPNYTILTTEATEQMARIHRKKRMPIILTEEEEEYWIKGQEIDVNRNHISLIETKV